MRWRDGFITSRYDQRQPLGAVTACLYPYGTAFNGAGLRTLGAAAYRVIKISQAEIALVIGPGKPFRRHAANTLTTRYVHAETAGNRLLILGQGYHGHRSFSFGAGLKRSAALQPCPSARPGSKSKGGRSGGGSPAQRGARYARVCTRLALMSS